MNAAPDTPRRAGEEPEGQTRYALFKKPAEGARQPRWLVFDDLWYAKRYESADSRGFYLKAGRRFGHAPSRLFDESWYLARNPDVRGAIEGGLFASGFEHYCDGGYLNRSPHHLFDELWYRATYPELFRAGGVVDARNYANGYDHYLSEGAAAGFLPSRFFDPLVWRMFRDPATPPDGTATELERALAELEADGGGGGGRVSWYFDPDWYLSTYPAVDTSIRAGVWSCALAHYLGNQTPTQFDPGPAFSETLYAAANPDVAAAVAAGAFRNNFEHFIESGAREGRNPGNGLDLAALRDARVSVEIEGGLYPDLFAFHVATTLDQTRRPIRDRIAPTEAQAKLIFADQARATCSALMRRGIDIALPPGIAPAVSVIMVLHNQFALTMQALASLAAQGEAIQLILVDSGSTDETAHIERHVHGARVIRFPANLGFIAGCNAALAEASADEVLFLNNDVLLGHGAVRAARARLASRADAGAVGARIVRANGRLQEAGCILWRDGRTSGYLRDADPDAPEAHVVREVDFCSGAFLLVRAGPLRALGGFDAVFAPAYYEDTDLCLRLRQAGFVTLYDPDVLVQHYEYGSSDASWSASLIARAREIFCERHREALRFQYNYRGTEYVRARSSARGQLHILMIEDRVPLRALGSGYVRSNDIVRAMAELGHAVTLFPVQRARDLTPAFRRDFPDTVEVMHDRAADGLASFLAERRGMYDLVWIGRTHNLHLLLPMLAAASGDIPDFGIVLDTEAVTSPREAQKRALAGIATRPEALAAALAEELAPAGFCQRLVAVNAADAALIRDAGHAVVDVLGHRVEPRPTAPSFAERSGILFVGAFHTADSPNVDALAWFVREILPAIGTDARLTVAGHVDPLVDIEPFTRDHRITFLGEVDDLAPLYAAHRVFVAPTRFAAGIPYKIHEAASFGIPVVATSLLARQLGWSDGAELLDGGDNDAARFAAQTARLLEDEALWTGLRARALARIVTEQDGGGFTRALAAIINRTLGRHPPVPSQAEPPSASPAPSSEVAPERVRLVIWDLDETFWSGTLTEGGIARREAAIDAVVELARRGIVSSICSKNDLEPVRKILTEWGVWDYFVFPSVNWDPKGPRIARLVEDVQLRAPTIMFIDDNPMNLREAQHFVPGLQIADETFVERILDDPLFKGKDDRALTRLAQYKLLETRHRDQADSGGDVHDFLRRSNITVEIEDDVEAHLDRAIELVNRTNQLNFTKARLPEDLEAARAELRYHLQQFYVQAGLVRVRDNYGDYGFVGLFVQHKGADFHDLAHYCFSCRTLGMHVETWLYRRLGRPRINVVAPVLTDLFDEANPVDWVRLYDPASDSVATSRIEVGRIFILGGCDLEAVAHYLSLHADALTTRLNTARDGVEIRLDHTEIVRLGIDGVADPAQSAALATMGYDPSDLTLPRAEMEQASTWLLSFWADAYYALFRHDASDVAAPCSPAQLGHMDVTTLPDDAIPSHATAEARQVVRALRTGFSPVGRTTEARFKANVARVLDLARPGTRIIVNLMGETPYPGHAELAARHAEVNRWTMEVLAGRPNVTALRIDDVLTVPEEQTGPTHYERLVYRRLADRVLAIAALPPQSASESKPRRSAEAQEV